MHAKLNFEYLPSGEGDRSPNLSSSILLELLVEQLVHQPPELNPLDLVKQHYSTHSFQLGDVIQFPSSGSPTFGEPLVAQDYVANSDLYIVYQGRVRLLCQRYRSQKALSIQLLQPGSVLGADSLVVSEPLLYRAIAASPCQVISIPRGTLEKWVADCPDLRDSLIREVRLRQDLIFFRQFTQLGLLPTAKLHHLIPYLIEQSIPVGTLLSEVCRSQSGCFWLKQGTIEGSLTPAPLIGERWGHPDPIPDDWVAHSDLHTYYLPIHHWERLKALIPELAIAHSRAITPLDLDTRIDSDTVLSMNVIPTHDPTLSRASSDISEQQSQSVFNPSATRSEITLSAIFPKPLTRRMLDALGRYPWIEQQSSSDCGAACLGIVCQYWGKRIPLYVLRERANVGRLGASLKSLAKAATNLGLQSRPVRASFGALADQRQPWIAHWEGDHYVVVFGMRGDRIIVSDPGLGRRSLSKSEFVAHWTGYGLLLNPTEQFHTTTVEQPTAHRYLQVLLPYRGLALQIILLSLLIQIFSLVTPLFTQLILDTVVVQKSLTTLNVFVIGVLLFGIWGILLSGVRQYLLSYCSNRLDLTLISGFIYHALSLPLKFFEMRQVGDILTRVQENQKIQRFLVGRVMLAWLNGLTGFVYLGLMLYYNWKLTLLVVALIPPIVVLTLGSTPFLQRVSRDIFKQAAEQNSSLVELLSGVATVKSMAIEQELRWRWEDHLTRQLNAVFRGQKLGIGLETASGLINTLGTTGLLWFGAALVIQGQLSLGQFVAFNMMLGYVISPVIELANLWDELQEVFVAVERLNDVFMAQPEVSPQQERLILPAIQGEIRFEDVTFRYTEDDDRNILQNISFTVQPGQTVAIVGRSGSGKSTLVKLVEGLYPPTNGRVIIDGYDIRHVDPHSLRSQMGVVPQDCFLFSGTLLENITLYRSDVTLDQVIEAAKQADAHVFIQSLPLGYSTKVGERGSTLSGGQRQRIAIARALLSSPQILILDEATSALDTESERRFQHNLDIIRCDRTTLIIAHRLSTVRNADHILVLDQGILVEQGTHTQLMQQNGLYATLAQQQLDL